MIRGGCVYILTNKTNSVLYTGVTSDLSRRLYEHNHGINPGSFTAKYNIHKLVYFQFFSTIDQAIAEEKRIKAGNRKKKLEMIAALNPNWEDLSNQL